MARKRPTPATPTVLAHKKASVSVHRNGVSIEELLDVFRTLVRAGYDELVLDAGSAHAGAFGDFSDEEGVATEVEEPTLRPPRRVGFSA
jgi:hypothetical protein